MAHSTVLVEKTDSKGAEIVIHRDSDRDIKMRGLEIYIDNEFRHDLAFSKTYSEKVLPGIHQVKISNHLYRKVLDLDLLPGETVHLTAGNSFTLIGGLMLSSIGIGPYKVFLQRTR